MKPDSSAGLGGNMSDSSGVGERLQSLVDSLAGGRKQRFADLVGIPQRTLADQIKQGSLRMDAALRIADATGTSLDWLLAGIGATRRDHVEIIPPPPLETSRDSLPGGYVSIPRYEVRASAGFGAINPAERIIDRMILAEEYIRRVLRRRPEDMALLEAFGDSMSPTIQDGDVMMIDISVTELRGSSIYVILIDGELSVKRLHKTTGGRMIVISDNERYPREEIAPDNGMSISIVGQVLWTGRPLPS